MEKTLLVISLLGAAWMFYQVAGALYKKGVSRKSGATPVDWNTVRLPGGQKMNPARVPIGRQAEVIVTGAYDWSAYETPAFIRRGVAPLPVGGVARTAAVSDGTSKDGAAQIEAPAPDDLVVAAMESGPIAVGGKGLRDAKKRTTKKFDKRRSAQDHDEVNLLLSQTGGDPCYEVVA